MLWDAVVGEILGPRHVGMQRLLCLDPQSCSRNGPRGQPRGMHAPAPQGRGCGTFSHMSCGAMTWFSCPRDNITFKSWPEGLLWLRQEKNRTPSETRSTSGLAFALTQS